MAARLYPIPDQATSALMLAFYHALWTRHLAPAAALREAQLTLAQDRAWANPYFWSAFTMQVTSLQ